MTSHFDVDALTLGEPVTSGKGGKSVPISYDGKPVVWTPDAQPVQYEPSSFTGEDVSRVNLVMRASSSALEQLTALDEAIISLAAHNSLKIFGKQLLEDEVRLRYNPLVKRSEKGYAPTWKTKVNLSGRSAVVCWDADRKVREQPEEWIACSVQPRVTLRALWVMSKEFGAMFECSDVLIDEAAKECPF